MKTLFVLIALFVGSISHAATATALVGQRIELTVTAAGTSPFTYQWKKDGSAIAGATANPLVIASASASDAGNYTVAVTNSAGSTNSDLASIAIGTVTVSGGAPDISKQSARATLSAPISLAAGVFTTLLGATVEDPANHYNPTTGFYTVGPGEDGRYQVIIRARIDDMEKEFVSYGLSADTANRDSAGMLWCTTFAHGAFWMRNGAINIVERSFAAGDQIRVIIYASEPLKLVGADFTIKRLN